MVHLGTHRWIGSSSPLSECAAWRIRNRAHLNSAYSNTVVLKLYMLAWGLQSCPISASLLRVTTQGRSNFIVADRPRRCVMSPAGTAASALHAAARIILCSSAPARGCPIRTPHPPTAPQHARTSIHPPQPVMFWA